MSTKHQGLTEAQSVLKDVIRNRGLLICVGSGGVGKTTTAASIGIQAAIEGRRVCVVTIDPARRLANSLGLEALGNDERQIPLSKFTEFGVEPKGTLHAMMLDTQTTFNELIRDVSPDDETRERILKNRVYMHLSDTLSASHDYMASEKLYDLHNSGRYDLVVLDTPPMKNAIDFLEASGRLSRFLDDRIVGWFLKPHEGERRFGLSLLQAPGALVYKLLGNVFGSDFLDEIAEFFLAFKDLLAGFKDRADAVSALLRDPALTKFVIVCTPQSTSMEEARYFHRQLEERRMPGGYFIVNCVGRYGSCKRDPETNHYLVESDRAFMRTELTDHASPKKIRTFTQRLEAHFDRSVAMARDDEHAIAGLRGFAGSRAVVATIPRMPEDIYDFDGLLAIDRHLFGDLELTA
ncbi:MAG: ArsA family ATPase [Proteobacteria bacterium]|nr:ArsA family ATPase [Pseudomonadota bacterium]